MSDSNNYIHPTASIHSSALIEAGVRIGAESSVWDSVHIRHDTVIGEHCIIGEKTYIAYQVTIGNRVKINSFVYICTGVTVEDQVMISAGTVFTNDLFPRAFEGDGTAIAPSAPTEKTLCTTVSKGTTIGANCTIGPGLLLGEYCMVGMGSVVTRDVAPYQLVYGNPAKPAGYICLCGQPLTARLSCPQCERLYTLRNHHLSPPQ